MKINCGKLQTCWWEPRWNVERMLGLVWSEVTVTTFQEGNGKGWFYRFYLKFCFISSRICSGTDNIGFSEKWSWGETWKFGPGRAHMDTCANLCPLTRFHPPLPYVNLNLEETTGRAPDGTFGDLQTVLALRPAHCVAVGKTFLGFSVFPSFHLYTKDGIVVFAYVTRILCQLMGHWALFSPVSQ